MHFGPKFRYLKKDEIQILFIFYLFIEYFSFINMLDLVYLILCLLSFININVKGANSFYEDYMDLENTNSIKGIFVWMIFFRHFTGYLKQNSLKNKKSILNLINLYEFNNMYNKHINLHLFL